MSGPVAPTGDVQATFCATLVDEWARAGVGHAVVCPGSRSTPLALALARERRVRVRVHNDERSAAFSALGIGLATGRPAVMLTTSGTAAVECHPAIVEADLAAVPMLVCTADRPREVWDVGAPQTIDQTRLFGGAVRWFAAPGVADATVADPSWRSLAARALLAATGERPGPVHLDLEFRDPLVADPGPLPPGRDDAAPWHVGVTACSVTPLPADDRLAGIERGVIIAGGTDCGGESLTRLAEAAGWPVLADPRSAARVPGPTTVATFDAVLRADRFAAAHRPDLVLQLGPLPASRVLAEWLDASVAAGAEHVVVDPRGRQVDPTRRASGLVTASVSEFVTALADTIVARRDGSAWLVDWGRAEAAARGAIDRVLDTAPGLSEPGIARAVVAGAPVDGVLVVASSMPVRDVEWYSAPRRDLRVVANRGANGIDGVVSTAVGVASTGRRVVALVGDLAFVHDANALWGLPSRGLDLTVVVVDNDGGGIFSFLPQASELDPLTFELLFGTPHGVDPVAVATAYGVVASEIGDELSADPGGLLDRPGTRVLVARTNRTVNVAQHETIHRAVAEALASEGLA